MINTHNPLAIGTNNKETFLPTPDETDRLDKDYHYYGWINYRGQSVIQREKYIRFSESPEIAVFVGDPTTFITDWTNRITLTYV